jgi:serine/threonine protein kinase
VVRPLATDQTAMVRLGGVPRAVTFHVLERGGNSLVGYRPPAIDGARHTVSVIGVLCTITAALHRRRIVHRDLKPSNFVTFGRTIRVIDFATSHCFDEPRIADPHEEFSRYWYPFSPFHAAPEMFCGLGRDHSGYIRADIWSLGATLYELWTGRMLMPELLPPDLRRALLLRFRGAMPFHVRLQRYYTVIEDIAARFALPALEPIPPPPDPAHDLLDRLYRSFAALDFRRRPTELTGALVDIETFLGQHWSEQWMGDQ